VLFGASGVVGVFRVLRVGNADSWLGVGLIGNDSDMVTYSFNLKGSRGHLASLCNTLLVRTTVVSDSLGVSQQGLAIFVSL
jgi:hypothetical protein